MQITLNQNEVSQIVLEHIQSQLSLDDSNTFSVELNDDGITVLVNEDQDGSRPANNEGKPSGTRKPRRTKQQIEADKAEEELRLAAEAAKGAQTQTATEGSQESTASSAQPSESATQQVVEEDGGSPSDTQPDEPTLAVGEQESDPAPETEEAAPESEPEEAAPAVKPQSLFANLRKPSNQ